MVFYYCLNGKYDTHYAIISSPADFDISWLMIPGVYGLED